MKKVLTTTHKCVRHSLCILLLSLVCTVHKSNAQFCPPQSGNTSNDIDFSMSQFDAYIFGIGQYQLNSPFYYYTNGNANISDFSNNVPKDNELNDGWRLLKYDFGSPNRTVKNPYIVLYNRYSGLLRVFMFVVETHPFSDYATITLSFAGGSNKSALLNLYNRSTIRNSVQEFSTGMATQKNIVSSNGLYWAHADFEMMFDPCTCIYESELYLTIDYHTKQSIDIQITGNMTQNLVEPKFNNSGSTEGSVLKKIGEGIDKVSKFQKAIKGTTILEDATSSGLSSFGSFIPLLKEGLGLADFLIGLFSSSKPQIVRPIVFDAELNGSGGITGSGNIDNINMITPGSNKNSRDYNALTSYNQVLGTFNLLKKPKIRVRNNTQILSCNQWWGAYDCGVSGQAQYFLDEPISWILNQESLLSVNTIKGALVFKQSDGTTKVTKSFPIGCLQDLKEIYDYQECYYYNYGACLYVNDVYLKITGSFAAPNGDEHIFSSFYEVSKIYDETTTDNLTSSEPSPSCNAVNSPATYNEVQSVCNSTPYITRVNSLTRQDTILRDKSLADKFAKEFKMINEVAMKVYPNPMGNTANISFSLPEEGFVSMYITDMTGKIIHKIMQDTKYEKGVFQKQIEREDILSVGMYLVVIETSNGKKVEKLIVD